jgi:hypothetical protein
VLPWTDGGGPDGTLVWSTEQQGMDTPAIEQLARDVLGLDRVPTIDFIRETAVLSRSDARDRP